ncbi:MAG: ATP-binding cassette domain-containing protein [Clostridia bacterium]|nr:ATP-binding cassette domain-containing protein [Clostridia bacterium]
MAQVQIGHLSFTYAGAAAPVLDDVCLSLEAGGFYVLCGDTGSGKTTLLRLIRRVLAPAGDMTGEIRLNGLKDSAADIGFVGQDPGAGIVTGKVWQELAFGPESLGMQTEDIRRRVSETAAWFGLEKEYKKETDALSGGKKQLLCLAAAVVTQPKLLLLDEPTAQLDPIAANAFLQSLGRLNREFGITVLLAEHRLEEVLPMADGLFALRNGRLIAAGPPQTVAKELKTDPLFAGFPAAARLWAALDGQNDCPMQVREGKRFLSARLQGKQARFAPPPPPEHGETVLEARDVWLRYEKEAPDVLTGFSCRLYAGEIFCILGGNGAGKTTALEVLAGIRRGYRGTLIFKGEKIRPGRQDTMYRKGLALLPQDVTAAFIKPTLRQDLEAQLLCGGAKKEDLSEAVREIADRFGLTALLERNPLDLSGGEKQKAAIAKLMLGDPTVLLLDEPTKGIDADGRNKLAALLKDMKSKGVSVLLVTHDAEFAARVADRAAMLFDGELLSEGPPASFFADNCFFTTAASRIAREQAGPAILVEQIVSAVNAAVPLSSLSDTETCGGSPDGRKQKEPCL